MGIKNKQIKFYCTDEEFKKINSNASRFGLATGTYLRLLGLLGGAPYAVKEPGASRSVNLSGVAGPASLGVFQERRSPERDEMKEIERPSKDQRTSR